MLPAKPLDANYLEGEKSFLCLWVESGVTT